MQRMAYTQEQADALRDAIAEGVTTLSSDGRTVTYRSLADMRSLLQEMEASLIGPAVAGNSRRVYMRFQRD
jgi:hypothetical protein